MLKGVLFDLDGTLLDINLDSFLNEYFSALGPVVAEVLGDGIDPAAGLSAVLDSTEYMTRPHPGQTNREAFNARFLELTGANLDLEEYAVPFERFYAEVFPGFRRTMGPREGAVEVVEAALSLGLKVAIATNPIFPLSAVKERMRWADIDGLGVHAVTAHENMHATKPLSAYFIETAEMIGVEPSACLMVGDDRSLDMTAADVGMRTFYVGSGSAPSADWTGTLRDLAALLPRMVAET